MRRFENEDAAIYEAIKMLDEGPASDVRAAWVSVRSAYEEVRRANRKLLKLLEAKLQGPPGPPGPTGPAGISGIPPRSR